MTLRPYRKVWHTRLWLNTLRLGNKQQLGNTLLGLWQPVIHKLHYARSSAALSGSCAATVNLGLALALLVRAAAARRAPEGRYVTIRYLGEITVAFADYALLWPLGRKFCFTHRRKRRRAVLDTPPWRKQDTSYTIVL